MRKDAFYERAAAAFRTAFGKAPEAAAHAPGRVEVLGNHTDYNEGFVLSAAIDKGTFFLAARRETDECRVVAQDVQEEVRFPLGALAPGKEKAWANYVKGVLAGLQERAEIRTGFTGLLWGDVPQGAGLSSSAALEMSCGLALGALYGIALDRKELARIGQAAEHRYAGVQCGLLDQITSLFGRQDGLVMTDFRSLDVQPVTLGHGLVFVLCHTRVTHRLVESEYNERRARCEEAARFFAGVLSHPVAALRDVTAQEYEIWAARMDPLTARRAAHVIGENTRVLAARGMLEAGRVEEFGRLMYESHRSSRELFQNSCRELDALVDAAHDLPGVLGARLSGGGFGGSAVLLVRQAEAATVQQQMAEAYARQFGHPCETSAVRPAEGAAMIPCGRG